jgi:hypothetical protein
MMELPTRRRNRYQTNIMEQEEKQVAEVHDRTA